MVGALLALLVFLFSVLVAVVAFELEHMPSWAFKWQAKWGASSRSGSRCAYDFSCM